MPATRRRLTPQQRTALEARDHSVSLAAGAGCGKTFVLTERFIAELDPATVDAAAQLECLVAITFTDAAAREMRDRIRRACYERLIAAEEAEEAAAWQRLMRSMDIARISTIHSFCTALLRTHAVEAGLDPRFEVLDAPAAELLRLETIDERLRTLLVERNDDVLDLAAHRGLERLRSDLAAFAAPRDAATIDKWLAETPESLVARWRDEFIAAAPSLATAELLASRELHDVRRLADAGLAVTDKLQQHLARLAAELDAEHIRRQLISATQETLCQLARSPGSLLRKGLGDARPLQPVQGCG